MSRYPSISEWDELSRLDRGFLVFSVAIVAPGVLVLGLLSATTWDLGKSGFIIVAISVAYLCWQALGYHQLRQRRTRG